MKHYLRLMRVKHWLKNGLVFLPLLFAGELFTWNLTLHAVGGFFSFSLLASVVYIINDSMDAERDRQHATKKDRPIASGKVSVKSATILAVVLLVLGGALNWLAGGALVSWALFFTYLALNLGYSLGLKNMPLLDLVILMSGFFIRVAYGSSVTGIAASDWLYLIIITFSFYMGLGKRRNEIDRGGTETRKVLRYYSHNFLDKNMYVCMGLCIVFYTMWCLDQTTVAAKAEDDLIWTMPLVLVIFMRYSMNIEAESSGDPVDVVLGDKVLMALVLGYLILMMFIIYFK
jgi:4-hydroxybenzoate polyprenyltransferase